MRRITQYALAATVFTALLSFAHEAHAQTHAISKATAYSRASVTIVDGISLGIRSSHQDGSTLEIQSNGTKLTVMTRPAGKLFRESFTSAASEITIERTSEESSRETQIAFE